MTNTKTSVFSCPITFHCREKIGSNYEEWDGYVKRFHNYGSHYEIQIESRSGFIFMVGKYINGSFISIPTFGVGCDLAGYSDYFWNNEHLAQLMNPVDAATVAETLRTLSRNR
ncbi:DUF6618 family protein [Candidatus Contubernalis alkaliaceticus]|uniref:DUF6618 family protein n=1 Tax=Candidatus Contubernalis alkaliaceticus TaxID=338645 RepID=UPI001F4BFB25|nr:DUF6618 family protein [Candidatus Contubernalis alkalaceticus]UNC92826.1 hypothetical protein HUE98_12395 [Candidatus Contubernalis alkalaceticus]